MKRLTLALLLAAAPFSHAGLLEKGFWIYESVPYETAVLFNYGWVDIERGDVASSQTQLIVNDLLIYDTAVDEIAYGEVYVPTPDGVLEMQFKQTAWTGLDEYAQYWHIMSYGYTEAPHVPVRSELALSSTPPPVAVPEPSALILSLAGLLALAIQRGRVRS